MPQFLVTEPGEEARQPKRDSTTNTWEKFTDTNGVKWAGTLKNGRAAWRKMEDAEVKKVRNARRPTLQDVAGGEISMERYRASARSQSHARQPTLQDVENGEISLEKYRASAIAQSSARRAPTLTPQLKFKLVALGTELGEDAAEAATDRLFGWALSELNLYKTLFPDGYLVNVGIGGAHTLKYGEMVPDFKGHVRVCASARPLTLHPYTPSTPSTPSASRPESGGAPADHAIRVPGAAGGGAVVVTARGQARLQQCLRVRTLSSLRRHTPLEVEPPPLRCRFLTSPEGLAMESSIEYVRFVPVVEVAEGYTHFFLHDKRSGLADVAKLAVPPSSASDLPVWGCARLLSARLDTPASHPPLPSCTATPCTHAARAV